jgi:gliding motility-associated-like protein
MWIESELDGTTLDDDIVGVASNLNQNGTYTFGPICTDGATNAGISIRNQNNTNDETNTFENVTIICWEGVPEFNTNDPICDGEDLFLTGNSVNNSDVAMWEWSNTGTGMITDINNPVTSATNPQDGETYTLTASDLNSCTADDSQTVSVFSAFTAELSGGGTICLNNCTDSSEDVVISLNGGSGSYTLSLTLNGGSIPFPFAIPINDFDESFTICATNDILPSIDQSIDPPIISIPSFLLPVTFGIDNISDGTCNGMVIGNDVTIDVAPQPNIVDPVSLEYCVDQAGAGTIDLTVHDDIINGGDNSLDVIYFESTDFDDEITDPENYTSTSNTVCAATFNGDCFSDIICFGIDLDVQATIDLIQDPLVDCYDGTLYTLPFILAVADVVPNTAFEGYFLNMDGSGNPVSQVDPTVVSEVFIIINSVGNQCDDISVPLQLDLTPNPTIDFPGNTIGGCGSVELPIPQGSNIGDFEYNTEEDGSGFIFRDGDIIEAVDNINTLFLIASNGNDCNTVIEIDIEITNSIDFIANIPATACDSLVLPDITPATPTVSYYTMTGGTGTALAPGDVIQAPFNAELFIFDPNEDPICAPEVSLNVSIANAPMTTLPADTSACNFYVLGEIMGTVNSPDYTIMPINFPSSFRNIGDTIRNTSTIYVLDTIGTCTLFDSLEITIATAPDVGRDTTIFACEGYSSTQLNLEEIIGNPDIGGIWSYPVVPDFIPVDPTMIDISVFPIGSYGFTYAIEDSICGINTGTITLEVEPEPFAGETTMIDICNAESLNFMSLISNPESGGQWMQVPLDTIDIIDSTDVDLSFLEPGEYFFLYVIPADGISFCEGNSASLAITIMDGPNAGADDNISTCVGTIINVRELLSSDAEDGGMFFPNGFFLSGDEWNTTGNPTNQTFELQYIIESTALSCESDTAFFEIFLSDSISAGTALALDPVCTNTVVDLSTYLENASAGGEFFLTQDLTTVVDNPLIVDSNDIEISYIVEGTASCPSDTTAFTVEVNRAPIIEFNLIGNDLCRNSGDCVEFTVTSTEDGTIMVSIMGDAAGESEVITIDIVNGTSDTYTFCATDIFQAGADGLFELSGISSQYTITSGNFNSILCGDLNPGLGETINMNESFSVSIETTLCMGDSILVNGAFFTSDTSLVSASVTGCDSTTVIRINNFPEAISEISGILCTGTPIDVFGNQITRDTIASFVNPGASFFGCDSIVNVDVQFQDVAIMIFDDIICDGMPVTVGTEIFDENRTTDDVLLVGGSVAGCDSLVMVDLTYATPTAETIAFEVCSGDTPIDINGTLYGPDLLAGMEVIENAAGCDSIITIDLTLSQEIMTFRTDTVCNSFSEIINGKTYDISNPSGVETLIATSQCDSIINIDFTFIGLIETVRNESVCSDFSEVINGTTYDINMPSGMEPLISSEGCDSIITIDFTFLQAIEITRDDQVCSDFSEVINGTTYDINMPSGMESLISSGGCDSIITIDLTFLQAIEVTRDDQVCSDFSEVINGTTYDINMPSGMESLISSGGCDSIITIDLTFLQAIEVTRDDQVCSDFSEVINGTTYDINMPSGMESLISSGGCDSIITINFTFVDPMVTIIQNDICNQDTTGSIMITAIDGINLPVNININGEDLGLFDNLPISIDRAAGAYDISIDDGSCIYQESVSILDADIPDSEIINSQISNNQNQLLLTTSTTPVNINWIVDNPDAILSCNDCIDPIVQSDSPYNATVQFSDTNGCTYEATIFIDNMIAIEVGDIYLPNVISTIIPGEDMFFPQTSDPAILIESMQIYDRYGSLIFEQLGFMSNERDSGWDGRRNDNTVEQGVYVYVIKYFDDNRERILSGDITLLR